MSCVREFHLAFDQPAPATPPLLVDSSIIYLRERLIREEFQEVEAELQNLRWAKTPERTREVLRDLLKELADLRYVVEGTAVSLGLPIDEAYAEVHRSNMSKLGPDGRPIRRDDGKALKGPDYTPPNMEQFVPEPIDIEGAPV